MQVLQNCVPEYEHVDQTDENSPSGGMCPSK